VSNIEVVGLGALNIDKIYKVERVLCDGEAVAEEMGCFPGGSAANTIHGLASLGVQTGYVGKIGKDNLGRFFEKDLEGRGIQPILFHDLEETGRAIALISKDSQIRLQRVGINMTRIQNQQTLRTPRVHCECGCTNIIR